jgi:hypothetical protein
MGTLARYGYNPNRAGERMVKEAEQMRATLRARLVKPALTDSPAFEDWVKSVMVISRMDHKELCAAIKAK